MARLLTFLFDVPILFVFLIDNAKICLPENTGNGRNGVSVGLFAVIRFETGNADLRIKMNLNKNQLFHLDDNVLELNGCIAAFGGLLAKPRATIGQHKLHTGNLTMLFAQVDSILYDRLDKLVVQFKISQPDFYNSYKNARNIINTSVRKRKGGEEKE
jgi:hypothetical protein